MALRRGRRERHFDYWPGFVDALSTFLLGIIFLLSVFMLAQYFLSRELAGKDDVLLRLNRQIEELSSLLSIERALKGENEEALTTARATLLAAQNDKARLQSELSAAQGGAASAGDRAKSLGAQVEIERKATQQALAQIDLLNQQISALRQQLATIESALGVAEARDKDSQTRIADLGRRLNLALAQKVQELGRYRSEFFGRLRDVLSARSDVRVVGDRFVFPSEVLFAAGQAMLEPEGFAALDKVAGALIEVGQQIPEDIPWVLRVDGHTDRKPIASPQFPSNWELSAARAIAVVRYLIAKGIPATRLVAAGFGEFQPIDAGDTPEALARNRRIELKLTER